jgi:hypothetical protein
VRRPVLAASLLFVLVIAAACTTPKPPSGSGGGGQPSVGEGGYCPMGPTSLLNLTILAAEGPVPLDTQLQVKWSGTDAETFKLDDKTTWKTLEDGVNLVCEIDLTQPPPADLTTLVCHVWTNNATDVVVRATGYETYEKTHPLKQSQHCGGPVPSDVEVTLYQVMDGGMP